MSDQTANTDTLLDIDLPEAEPEIYEFDGDIVAAEVQKPLPEWGDEAKDRIKVVVRDWDRTLAGMEKGLEKAYVFFPQGMSLSGGRTAALTKFSNNAKNKLGVTLRHVSDFIGLSAHFQLAPARKGNGDVLSIVGKPKATMPGNLASYVPKVREAGDGEQPEASTQSSFEVDSEGLAAIREALGGTRDPKEARRILTADRPFRAKNPASYAAFISNPEVILERLDG